MKQFKAVIVLSLLLTPLLFTVHQELFAQSADTGAIFGTVTDKTSAVVPGTKVTLTNERTAVVKALTTNTSGFYSFEALPSADYALTVERDGFMSTTVKNIHLDPAQRRDISPRLSIGAIATSVTVEADALNIQTETSDVSATMGSEEIATLLVNGRNFQSLATLSPGVNNTTGDNQYSGGGYGSNTTLAVDGTGIDQTTYTIDGVYNMNTGSYNNLNITPSMDAISEFTLLKSNFSARYGTASNSVVLVDTKSGTSAYHGSAWDYLRNDALDASNYYSLKGAKSELRQNIYGFSLGGPLQIPRLYNSGHNHQTFFFASDEFWSKTVGISRTAYVITQAMRGGNLQGSVGMPAGGLALTSEGQQLLAAEGKTDCIKSSTALNTSCLDSDALAILTKFQPTENATAANYNYLNTKPDTFSQTDHDYRIDHNFTPNETLMARVMYEETDSFAAASTGAGSNVPNITTSDYTTGLNAEVRLTSMLGHSIVNTASAAETYDKPRLHAQHATMPSGASIAYYYPNANTLDQVPNITISGYDPIGPGPWPVNASDGEGIINDDISIVRGHHTLQAGGFYIFGIKNQITGNQPWGSFSFDGTYTGSGAADFLLGLDHNFTQDSEKPHFSAHYRTTEFYVQDDWKATPRLTLNAGVRFFYYSPDWLTGTDSKTSNYDFSRYIPSEAAVVLPNGQFQTDASGNPITSAGAIANLQNGLVFNTDPGVPRGFYNEHNVDPAPRLGFAYALTADGRTSLFGGYGAGYTRIPFRITDTLSYNPPGVANVHFMNGTLEDPTAGSAQPKVPTPEFIAIVNTNFKPTNIQNFSLTLQREVARDAIFQLGYVGSVSHHIRLNVDMNQSKPTTAPYSNSCLAVGQSASSLYDFDPCLNTGVINQDYIRPYQGWDGLVLDPSYSGNANYHSLQSQFRLKRGDLQTTVNYTYGKAMGNANGGNGSFSFFGFPQNNYCISCEYGPLSLDRTHIFSGNVIYAIPNFKHSSRSIASEVLGGWSLSGIALAQSGFALNPGLAAPDTGLASRPDRVGPLHISNNRNQRFNVDAFKIPNYGFFGNATNGSIRGPRDVAFNAAAYKTFSILPEQRLDFQFRAEAFNLANHPNFTGVNTGIGPNDTAPGLVTGPQDPRIFEVVGRFTF